MPPMYQVDGEPEAWTGETWFQLARPKRFECPSTGKPCTWVLGEKVEVRTGTTRPPDVLPSVWYGLFSQSEKRKTYQTWINVKKPAIELAEIERSKNGIGFLRKDDDLMAALGNPAPIKEKASAFSEELVTADGRMISRAARKGEQSDDEYADMPPSLTAPTLKTTAVQRFAACHAKSGSGRAHPSKKESPPHEDISVSGTDGVILC